MRFAYTNREGRILRCFWIPVGLGENAPLRATWIETQSAPCDLRRDHGPGVLRKHQ
jgi:hypothetical protein